MKHFWNILISFFLYCCATSVFAREMTLTDTAASKCCARQDMIERFISFFCFAIALSTAFSICLFFWKKWVQKRFDYVSVYKKFRVGDNVYITVVEKGKFASHKVQICSINKKKIVIKQADKIIGYAAASVKNIQKYYFNKLVIFLLRTFVIYLVLLLVSRVAQYYYFAQASTMNDTINWEFVE